MQRSSSHPDAPSALRLRKAAPHEIGQTLYTLRCGCKVRHVHGTDGIWFVRMARDRDGERRICGHPHPLFEAIRTNGK